MRSDRNLPRPGPRRLGAGTFGLGRFDWRTFCFVQLNVIGFLVRAVLLSWGLLVLVFVALGGFSLDGLMAQLNNLTARYIAADPVRQGQFKTLFVASQLLLVTLLALMRFPALLRGLKQGERS